MSWMTWRMFGMPRGLLGRLGGAILGGNGKIARVRHALDCLGVEQGDSVLEIGFGPGIGIRHALRRVGRSGFVAGVDPSEVMLRTAQTRNREAIERDRADLRLGTVADLPFAEARFDKAFTMYSVLLWADIPAGLREMLRTLRPDGQIVLAAHRGKGIDADRLVAQLRSAGFIDPRVHRRWSTLFFAARKP